MLRARREETNGGAEEYGERAGDHLQYSSRVRLYSVPRPHSVPIQSLAPAARQREAAKICATLPGAAQSPPPYFVKQVMAEL